MKDFREEIERAKKRFNTAKERTLRFVLVGLTGAGKSSTINALFGESVAEVDKYRPTTHAVAPYTNELSGIKYEIFDTPGLGESEDENQNLAYIEMIKNGIREVDCVLYVTHLEHPRVSADEKRCIRQFTEAFGSAIWEHSVIVFTTKNQSSSTEYETDFLNRNDLINEEVNRFTNNKNKIPAVAINISSRFLPDKSEWLPSLFMGIFDRISESSRLTFAIANAERLSSGEIPLSEEQKLSFLEKIKKLEKDTVIAGAIAIPLAGAMGAIIGGPVGAAVMTTAMSGIFWWMTEETYFKK